MFRSLRHSALLALAIPAIGLAGPTDWAEVHALTMRGIDRLYDMKIDEAAATFDSVRRMAPGDPRGYFFGSMVHFWLFTLTRDEKEYRTFLEKSDEVIAVCERLLEANPSDAQSLFYLGGAYGYRGLAHQADNSIFKAVTEGRKGYLALRDAVHLKADLYDAQMGFGLFTYMVAKVPRSLSWVLSLVGFSGDAAAGMAMVRLAAERGVYTRTEARFYLSQFLFAEHRNEEALALLDTLTRLYPHNALFLATEASWLSRLGSADSALATARKAASVNAANRVHTGEEFIASTFGGIYFSLNDFARARSSIEAYLRGVATEDYVTNWTLYRLAVSQELCGDRKAALATYGRMKSGGGDRPGEFSIARAARRWKHDPITASDALLIVAGNALGRRAYDSAAVYYGALASADDPDIRAPALSGLQQVRLAREDWTGAVEAGATLVALAPKRETWAIPQGYYQTGLAYVKMGRKEEARAAFERALSFDEDDLPRSLAERARAELERLKP